MLTYRHVVTFGTTQKALLSNITDLAITWFGGRLVLLSTNGFQGGVTSFATTSTGDAIRQIDSLTYPASFTHQGSPEISILSLSRGPVVHLGQLGGAASLGIPISKNGDLGSFSTTLTAAELGNKISAIGTFESAAGRFLYSANARSLTLETHRITDDGKLTDVSSTKIPLTNLPADATLDKIIELEVGGQRMLVTISGLGNFISTHLIGEDNVLDGGAVHLSAQGTGYYIPSDVEAVQFGGKTFLVVAGSTSSSVTVFQLAADGGLKAVDHILDEGPTRFQSATAMATAVVDGRAYLFMGGADDGISVFTMLPDGSLLHLTTIADTDVMTLADVSDIEAQVIGGKIALFVTSATETGITQFEFDPGSLGMSGNGTTGHARGTSGDDLIVAVDGTTRLFGEAGDDILVSRSQSVSMTGGAGADTFVATRFDGRIAILDYEKGVDRLDLSMLGMIRSTWQLTFSPQSYGIKIFYGNSVIDIFSADGMSLDPSDFGNDMFPVAHYWLRELEPKVLEPSDVPSTVGRWIFGSDEAETLLGHAGPDRIEARGGDDTIAAGGGMDTVWAGDGNDLIRGHDGHDLLFGGNGRDTIFGDNHNDTIYGDAGHDYIDGGKGHDRLYGGSGNDRIYGNIGDDRLYGGSGNDTLSGDDGDDWLEGISGRNRLFGGAGNDTLLGGRHSDLARGGIGDDLLLGGAATTSCGEKAETTGSMARTETTGFSEMPETIGWTAAAATIFCQGMVAMTL